MHQNQEPHNLEVPSVAGLRCVACGAFLPHSTGCCVECGNGAARVVRRNSRLQGSALVVAVVAVIYGAGLLLARVV
jgi:hypothetical protein